MILLYHIFVLFEKCIFRPGLYYTNKLIKFRDQFSLFVEAADWFVYQDGFAFAGDIGFVENFADKFLRPLQKLIVTGAL